MTGTEEVHREQSLSFYVSREGEIMDAAEMLFRQYKDIEAENHDLKVENRILATQNVQQAEEIRALKAELDALQRTVSGSVFEADETVDPESGHSLLGRNQKIVVIGAIATGRDNLRNIAVQEFGFEDDDFDFISDYRKLKNYPGLNANSHRTAAVIFGAQPHKTAGTGDMSSAIENMKNQPNFPFSVEAREKGGKLKITEASFREALQQAVDYMKSDDNLFRYY